MSKKKYTASSFWDQAKWDSEIPRNYWTSNPLINSYANLQMTGSLDKPNTIQWFGECFLKSFFKLPVDRGASVGCGTGIAERQTLDIDLCKEMDGFDFSPDSLKSAKVKAQEKGYDTRLHYINKDLNKEALPEDKYNFIISFGCLHHIVKLEFFLSQVNAALKNNGLFYFNEYIGPSRFQWTDKQLDVINKIAKLLPIRCLLADNLKRMSEDDLLDPSESIRSEEIMFLAENKFELLDVRYYGGTILYPLWAQVVRPEFFLDPFNEEYQTIFKLLILLDESLTKNLKGHFVQVVACRKDAPSAFIQKGHEISKNAPRPELGDWLAALSQETVKIEKRRKYFLTRISIIVNKIYRALQIIKNHGFRTLYRETKSHFIKRFKG